ncbi:hypothetical protein D3Z45_15580 [Lachnospiraceae bacterium]|nr:hypothetical protein [Lachnospiraceae bacterium]
MNKIVSFIKSLTWKQIVCSAIVVSCLALWVGLTVFATVKKNGLLDQMAAKRWSEENNVAQISCFFTESTEIDKNRIRTFENDLDKVLLEASITAPNENARLWADAYSASGKITLSSGKTSLTDVTAVGIGGDFFLFHPVRLLDGAYFSGNDLMHDKVIIDEEAAWQLFGSNDVVGMEVKIGGIPHYIAGVIKREDGRFAEAAGLNKTVVYVSCETLEEFGVTEGIDSYEIVMPNPVKNFAYNSVKEKFGMDENHMWVVENSARFGWKGLFTVVSEFGLRSMNNRAIRYPYWENVARGWEDVLAVVLILQILCLLTPSVIFLAAVVAAWRRKQWTWKDVGHFLVECKDRMVEKARGEKNKWKHF